MSVDYGLLRTTHRLLKQITDLNDRINRGPKKIKLVENNEANFLAALSAAKELVTKTKMAADAKQLTLSEREAKIVELKIRLNTCDTNKEFQLIKERIAADEQANSVLQDEILEMLERIDGLVAELETAKTNHAKSQAETKKVTDATLLELDALNSELDRVSQTLIENEKQLPAELMREYRLKVKGLGEDALGETDTHTCGNCHQSLTTQTVADLMMKRVVFCQGCGCVMYVASP